MTKFQEVAVFLLTILLMWFNEVYVQNEHNYEPNFLFTAILQITTAAVLLRIAVASEIGVTSYE